MEQAITVRAQPVGFFDKLRMLVAAGVAVALVGYVGWMVAEPTDPQMGVTFTEGGRSIWATWPSLLVLTVVAAAVGSAVAGPRLPEAGMFAAAIGLAGLALHGGSMQTLLVYEAGADPAGRRHLMVSMAVDAVLWAGLLAVSWVVVGAVGRWLWGNHADGGPDKPEPPKKSLKNSSSLVDLLGGGPLALAVTSIVAMFVIWMTVARTPVANIARGQVIASVFFGLYLGAMAGRYFTGIDHARYYLPAPFVAALVGFLLGYLQANMAWASAAYAQLATTPLHALARPLPIEYIGVGLAGTIFGFWSAEKIEQVAGQERS
jgi:hypothetical protein